MQINNVQRRDREKNGLRLVQPSGFNSLVSSNKRTRKNKKETKRNKKMSRWR
jgi:hypothetical protein